MAKNGLQNGFCPQMVVTEELKSLEDIERAIIKRYRKYIWAKFIKAIKEYDLIQDNDKIAIAISGGKDSLLLAKLFQELQRNGKNNFKLEFIAMDPGYHKDIRQLLEENCKYLNIPVTIYDSDIFKVADKISSDYPCYMCARMRRGSLYAKAKELGCNKLALGHHFDDVIETNLLNILCAGNFKTMMPKLRAQNFDNMEIIRPMYFIREESIIKWMSYTGLMPMNCACMVAAKKIGSTRYKIKDLIKQLEDDGFTNVAINIFRSCENVDMDRILGYINEEGKHSFLDNY